MIILRPLFVGHYRHLNDHHHQHAGSAARFSEHVVSANDPAKIKSYNSLSLRNFILMWLIIRGQIRSFVFLDSQIVKGNSPTFLQCPSAFCFTRTMHPWRQACSDVHVLLHNSSYSTNAHFIKETRNITT